MLYNGLYFHNVSELEQRDHGSGVRLQRFPKEVRHQLSEKGRWKAVQSNGCELRFVTEAKHVRVTVASQETNGRVFVFRGDFFHSAHTLQAGVVQTLQLDVPERFADVIPERLNNRAFQSNVWRLYFDRFSAVFYEVESFGFEVRAPYPEEMPRLTMLAYGSSITQGAGALANYNCYVQQAARRLEMDVLNLGLSGSCYCEAELADHLAERHDWDIAYLELGVNMRSVFTVEAFKARIHYLLDSMIERHPGKPVFLTTMYPNRGTYCHEEASIRPYREHEEQFNDVLRSYCADKQHKQLHLLNGSDIMTDFVSLTSDLIHPSDYGHMLMGEQVARLLCTEVERLRAKAVGK
ncbi:SGNH/GDSL hydrolase family protein [Paenibacillus rigui]|uniref:Lipase n=1 Tax=Paenibacillus rigui TaxID=554312 RepID=A0A229UU41_9BACL|nr:SGNH/GDSL hydrolase family protein [Paenibacillus rigui]OXM87117.1 lipase [Paenibacillus rigui]